MAGASESKYVSKIFSPGFSGLKRLDISALSAGKTKSTSKHGIEYTKSNKDKDKDKYKVSNKDSVVTRKLFGGKRRKSSKRRRSRRKSKRSSRK